MRLPLPSPGVRPRVLPGAGPVRLATALSVAAAALAVAVELTVGWGDAAPAVLAAGLVLGVAATVHRLPPRQGSRRRPALAVGTAVLGCAVLAAAAWLLSRAAPGPLLLGLLALCAWLVGREETAFADLRAGRPLQRSATAAVVLGGLVLLVPAARGADAVARVLAAVAPGSEDVLAPAAVAAVLVTVPLAAAALAAERLLSGRWPEAAEVGALLVLVLVVPPAAAVGVWAGCWHAVRSVARRRGALDLRACRDPIASLG